VATSSVDSVFHQLFAYHFMVNAFAAGTIVAMVAGIVGWFMVLRRQSFVGHTLAVVSFPGAAAAIWLGVSATLGYFAGSVAAAVVIALVPRSGSGSPSSEESAVIGTVQAFALACGVLFVSLYGGFLDSLTGLLFGTFLGVSDRQVLVLALVGLGVLAVMAVIGRPLLFASVDADVAAARRVPVRTLSVVFLLVLGCTAAEVSQITGALLVFALLVMPAAAAQQLTARPARSLVATVAIGVAVTWSALAVAYFSVYPVGFFVTTFGFAAYLVAAGIRVGAQRARRRHPAPLPAATSAVLS
jgi:zinc/manganese transport system permease protein